MLLKRIKELRIENRQTQQEIAEYLHCNRLVYARYENGIREIPVSMLIQLAKLFDVSMDYLVDLED